MVHIAGHDADTLDEYIRKLETLRSRYGGYIKVMSPGGDYPEGANCPHFREKSDGYYPQNCIVLS